MHGSSHAEADDAWVMSAEKDPLPRGLSGDMLAEPATSTGNCYTHPFLTASLHEDLGGLG